MERLEELHAKYNECDLTEEEYEKYGEENFDIWLKICKIYVKNEKLLPPSLEDFKIRKETIKLIKELNLLKGE